MCVSAAVGIAWRPIGKRSEEFGHCMLMAIMVETYAIFSLLISMLLIFGVKL